MRNQLFSIFILCLISGLTAQSWERDDSVFNPSGIPSLSFSQTRFADLDGDGDYDFVLGNTDSAPVFIKNDGTVTNPHFVVGTNYFAGISDLDAEMGVCADMNGDGLLDLVTGGFTGLHLFLNNGTASVPNFVESDGYFNGLDFGHSPVPDVADVDNDGDPDLVVGLSESGEVYVCTNTGTATNGQFSQAQTTLLGDVGLYAYPIFCDFDHDGDQDILVGRDNFGFVYYQNLGTASTPDWVESDSSFSALGQTTYWNSPDLVDLNNDGHYDLVFGTSDGPLKCYYNTGTDAAPVWQENTTLFGGTLDVSGASSPVFYDFDGDGDLDLICDSMMGEIHYFENVGTNHAPAWQENSDYFSSIDHSIYGAADVGDVNGDGLPDVIAGDLSGQLFLHINTGTGFEENDDAVSGINLGGWSVPRLVDMDGDGDLDLTVGNEDGNLYYYRNQGTATSPNWVERDGFFDGIPTSSNRTMTFGDIDGDGDVDCIVGNLWGEVHCYLHNGNSWTADDSYVEDISADQNSVPALADLDHDGDLDLIVGNYGGTLQYYRNLEYSAAVLNPVQNLTASLNGQNAVLQWNAPTAGSTSPFVDYRVYLDSNYIGSTVSTEYTLANLPDGITFTATVTAEYVAGESAPEAASFTTGIHNPPTDLTYNLLTDRIHLSWTVPQGSSVAVTGYTMYVDSVLVTTTETTSADIMNPVNGTTYHVAIVANYADGGVSSSLAEDIEYLGADDLFAKDLGLCNAPNPFNPSTTITFSLPKAGPVILTIYNTRGQVVRTLASGILAGGTHRVTWNGSDDNGKTVASGVYFYRLQAGEKTITRKMMMMK